MVGQIYIVAFVFLGLDGVWDMEKRVSFTGEDRLIPRKLEKKVNVHMINVNGLKTNKNA